MTPLHEGLRRTASKREYDADEPEKHPTRTVESHATDDGHDEAAKQRLKENEPRGRMNVCHAVPQSVAGSVRRG